MITDCHVDLPWAFTKQRPSVVTVEGMKAGGVDRAICALYLSDAMQDQLGDGISIEPIYQQFFALRQRPELLFALEGGRLIHNNLNQLRAYKLICGIKYLTLTHNYDTEWASSATDDGQFPLTPLGKEVVGECEKLHVTVDVSHCSDPTIDSVLDIATRPVIASHSGARCMLNHPRNLTDTHILRIFEGGGTVCVPFARRFVKDIDGVVRHICHIIHVTGSYESVGIGSDLDGAACVVQDMAGWKIITDKLSNAFRDEAVKAICGDNVARVLGIADCQE